MLTGVRCASLAVALVFCGCTRPRDSGVKVIVGARLEPGGGREPIEYSVAVIADGKFRDVGPQSSTPVPQGAEVTRGLGLTMRPLSNSQPIEAGQPADLTLEGAGQRRQMRNGEWVQ